MVVTRPTRNKVPPPTRVLAEPTPNIKDEYEFGRVLGEGAFGICYLGTQKKSKEQVAIKKISKGKILNDEEKENIRNEIKIMEAVKGHNNIVSIFGAYEDEDSVYIVLELCAGGDLFEKIISKGKYSEKDCATLCRQMLIMLDHCHTRGVIHRDLKPENFLLDSDADDAVLKATDFGLSCFFLIPEILSEPCGTPMYIAPEVIRGHYTHKADIWSTGCVLYILLSGKVPFYGKSDEDILRSTLRAKYNIVNDPWPHISEQAKECVKLMLTADPNKRPDAAAMLRHPWMKENGTASATPLVASVLHNLNQFHKMNKFKKRAMQVMATNAKPEELLEVRKAFDAVDTDRSGTITMQEMKAALENMGKGMADGQLMAMIESYDIDGDGTINYGEFLTATADIGKINTADNFRYAFKKFDTDGDGCISVDEVMYALRDVGIDELHAKDIVREADSNQNGVIEYDEFVTMMTKKDDAETAASNIKNKNLSHLASKAIASIDLPKS